MPCPWRMLPSFRSSQFRRFPPLLTREKGEWHKDSSCSPSLKSYRHCRIQNANRTPSSLVASLYCILLSLRTGLHHCRIPLSHGTYSTPAHHLRRLGLVMYDGTLSSSNLSFVVYYRRLRRISVRRDRFSAWSAQHCHYVTSFHTCPKLMDGHRR